jgi:GTP-binding protein
MKKVSFKQAQFAAAVFTREAFPKLTALSGQPMPEIAIAGRSNVGKSSLINHLLQRKLAKTSPIPGKTQSINFFCIEERLALVDLPGYGYAKAPKKTKEQWSELIDHYLENRAALQLILILIDSRREPTVEDRALIEWASFHKKPILFVFTKADKINEDEKLRKSLAFWDSLGINSSSAHFLHYSIKDPRARIQLIEKINGLVHGSNS